MDDLNRLRMEDPLTERELEIMRLIANGMTNQAVADQLFISFETVKWYLKQIYSKLHVSNRVQAIEAAHTAGLLERMASDRGSIEPRHNLPLQTTPFVGRITELARLNEFLNDPDCRLVTMIGLGGIGKTRLALETAAAQLPRFRDGVYLTALASLLDPNLIPIAIAEAVQLSFAPGQTPKNQLFNYLHNKQMLLVLDNFEHLLAGVDIITELLQTARGIKILVTSRERLHLQSERVFRIEGLAYANWITPEAAAASSAAQLFLQSAKNVHPSFELNQDATAALYEICHLVRGMPLGILLAASWVDTLSITEIALEIKRSFEFLEGEWRDLPERQRSLFAVFEHSWDRLTEVQRSAMCCCSLFRGGFTRDAAEQVAAASLKTLMSLVNASLLTRDTNGRFDMHELLRQYSAGKLTMNSDARLACETRQADFFAQFVDARWTLIRSTKMKLAAEEIELDIDNVRAAWNVVVDGCLYPQMMMISRVLWYFLMIRARYEEGIDLFGRAARKLQTLPASPARDLALGEVLHNLGFFYTANGVPAKGKDLAEESLAILQNHAAAENMARAYITLCRSEDLLGEPQKMKNHAQQGITEAMKISDPWYLGFCLFLLGVAEVNLGQFEEAFHASDEALKHLGRAEDSYYQGLCLSYINGRAAMLMGHYEEAKQYHLRSLAHFEDIQDHFEIAQLNGSLSEVYALLKEYDSAKRAYQNSLAYYMKAGQPGYAIASLCSVSRMYELQGEHRRAVEIMAFVMNHPSTFPMDKQQAHTFLEQIRASLPVDHFSADYERGKVLDLEAIVSELVHDS